LGTDARDVLDILLCISQSYNKNISEQVLLSYTIGVL